MSTRKKRNISHETKHKLAIDLTNKNKDLKLFPHPFYEGHYGVGCQPKTLIELNMIRLSGIIRSKPKWYEKMNNRTIRNKWKKETLEQNLLTVKQIDYVLDELEYYNSIRDGTMEMSSVDGVWQSDELIPNHIKKSLITYVNKLENIPENEKDWHPGTNKQILDLVHPSLFCYVHRMTRIINDKNRIINLDNALEHISDGEIIDINANELFSKNKRQKILTNYARSNEFQWLPTEFNISNDGQVKIESYINNLHPIEHKDLYKLIEQIFQRFIPLFNKVLTDLIDNKNKPNRIIVDPYGWYKDSSPLYDDEEEEDTRPVILPDVEKFQMSSLTSSTSSNIDLRGRKLQVIVKLANIVLTPDNPIYPGGVWHVEGMENEHIVATGIFYYSNSNITQSDLQFRTVIKEPDYPQNDERGVQTVYGLNDEEPLNQMLGEIITQENRCIVFPNIYQHRVASFQLKEPTKPGYRKILVFFLVDPSIRILSTANVPPQQSHWLINIIRSIPPFNKLPSIIVDKIINYIDFPMNMNQAKQYREKLMNERKYFISQNNELLFERPFSLCEH
ncbi:unnamed protein product [Rotaria sp. Silwood1]|nr:unnamed protein product [Rotaria sp. Silwood1]CAF4888001.1 unnamed protein product [Rotaria sp. Silwood1]